MVMIIISIEELRINCMKLLNVEIQRGAFLLDWGRIERYEKEALKRIPKQMDHSID